MEFYLKPLIRLKEITVFDLDDAKARPLVLAAGYRYLSAPGKPWTNRIPIAVTSHLPIKAKLLLTDRNRADLDWSSRGLHLALSQHAVAGADAGDSLLSSDTLRQR